MNTSFKTLRNHSKNYVTAVEAHNHFKHKNKIHEESAMKKRVISKQRKRRIPKGYQFIAGDRGGIEMEDTEYSKLRFNWDHTQIDVYPQAWQENKPNTTKEILNSLDFFADLELRDELYSIVRR